MVLAARASYDMTRRTLRWYRDLHEPERWAPTGERILAIRDAARALGTEFTLLILPIIWHLDGDYPLSDVHARIAAFARANEIEVVDGLEAEERKDGS